MGLSNQRYWGKNITKNPSCQFLNFTSPTLVAMDPWAMKQPPAKNPTNIPVAWWWCSWFLIVTSDTAQTAEEAVTLKVLAGFFFWQLHIWQIEIWIFKVMEGAGRQYYIFRFQFTQLQDICIVSVYIPGTQMTFLFECQPFKNKAEIPIKTAGSVGFQVPNIFPGSWGFFRRFFQRGSDPRPLKQKWPPAPVNVNVFAFPCPLRQASSNLRKKGQNNASWWFQPIWNKLVKLDHLPR